MSFVFDLMVLIVQSIAMVFINPLFWIVLVLIYNQYKKAGLLERQMLGKERYSVWERMLSSATVGLAGGLTGSIVMVIIGVTLDNTGIIYVWIIAVILMLINPRYMCFSYGGGIISLTSLIFGFPKIDVPALMAIVAILHLVESVLIFLNGSKQSIPVFMKHKTHGIVGAFNLIRFWPIPIIIMTVVIGQFSPSAAVEMPDWWPLLKPMDVAGDMDNVMFLMLPVVAALGYSDIAMVEVPERKSRRSSMNLLAYSVVLLVLSVISSYHRPLQWLAAIFGPAFHELLIITGRRQQMKGEPIFVAPDNGVRVLDVFEGGPADKMGLMPGDVITGINGIKVAEEDDLSAFLQQYPTFIWLDRRTLEGEVVTTELSDYSTGIGKLEIVLVPKEGHRITAVTEISSPLKRLLKKLRGRTR